MKGGARSHLWGMGATARRCDRHPMTTRTIIGGLATAAWLAALTAPALAAPSNDDFERAQAIGLDRALPGTIDGASTQPGDPGPGSVNVWYAYTATTNGPVAVELPMHHGSIDTPPRVFVGADRAHLTPAATADQDPWYSRTVVDAVAGQTYRIMVTGWQPDGRFALRVRQAAPAANDDFADAARVRVPGLYEGTLEDATTELGEVAPAGTVATTWYRIRPRHSSRLTVDASDAWCNPSVGAFTGDDVSSLHRIDERSRTIRFHVTRGRTYLLRLACGRGPIGDYTLDISDGSIEGKGVHMDVAPGQTVGSVLRRGLRLDVGARRKVGVSIDLRVSSRTARALGLRSRTLGHVGGTLGYGQRAPATLKLTGAARRALAGRNRLDATLRLTLRDHGPNRVLNVQIHLRRGTRGA